MGKKGEKSSKKISNIRDILFWGSVSIQAISVILDICSCPYWFKWMEQFFCYNRIKEVVPVILVIWTCTTALIVLYLGKKDDYCYGIRLLDILRLRYSNNYLSFMAVAFFLEILALVLAVIVRMPITIVTSAIAQIINMGYAFFIICTETSEKTVLKRVAYDYSATKALYLYDYKKMIQDGRQEDGGKVLAGCCKNMLLVTMIRNLRFNNRDDVENLLKILTLSEKKTEQEEDSIVQVGDKCPVNPVSREICRQLTGYMLEKEENWKIVSQVLTAWFMDDNVTVEMKMGILTFLMEYSTSSRLDLCQKLLKIEQRYQNELYIWCIVYHTAFKMYENEEWRGIYTEKLLKERDRIWNRGDQQMAMEFWIQCQGENKNGDSCELLKIILLDAEEDEL